MAETELVNEAGVSVFRGTQRPPSGGSQTSPISVLKSTDDVFSLGALTLAIPAPGFSPIATAFAAGYGILAASTAATSENFNAEPSSDWLVPFFLGSAVTVDRLGAFLNTGEDGKTLRLAIYEADANGQPTNLVVASAAIAVDTANNGTLVSAAVTPTTIPAGNYVAALNTDATAATIFFEAPTIQTWAWSFAGTPGTFGRANPARAYAAFPSTYPGGWVAADVDDGAGDGASHPLLVHLTT